MGLYIEEECFDAEIYKAAAALIRKHGSEALLEAQWRIERSRFHRYEDETRFWEHIAKAVKFLQMPLGANDVVH